jgi:hypothetical protein
MDSERTLIFAGEDEASAVDLLNSLRARDIGGSLRSAFIFDGVEPAARVIIMDDVPDFIAEPIKAAFPGICQYRIPEPEPNTPSQELQQLQQLAEIARLREMLGAEKPQPKRRGRPPKVRPA